MAKPRELTASDWAFRLAWPLDAIALLSVAGTGEVHPGVFAAVAAVLALSRAPRAAISQRVLLWSFVGLILSAIGAWIGTKTHPIVATAHAAPLIHALLWLSSDRHRYLGWRLGVGFLELILASALTAEIYLPLFIILFVIVGAVCLSCLFLHFELKQRAPEQCDQPMPSHFVRNGLGSAFLIFLTSAIIFPILPRPRGAMDLPDPMQRVGYTERVNVSEWKLVPASQDSQTVLRIYPQDGQDLEFSINQGLFKSRVLDRFDGRSWAPSMREAGRKPAPPSSAGPGHANSQVFEVAREPLHSDALPVPYGTREVWIEDETGEHRVSRLRNGEWLEPGSADRRIRYRVVLDPNDFTARIQNREQDPPSAMHRAIPDSLRTEKLQALSAQLFRGASSETEKIQAVLDHFRKNSFKASFAQVPEETGAPPNIPASQLSPLEQFLFVRKEGHCEWYASSTALLLRMGGVPTRLVAGFRLSRASVQGMLILRHADAHAWLEAWSATQGWTPIDPTPRLLREVSPWEAVRDGFDVVSAYWYRYVVTYGEQTRSGHSFNPGASLGGNWKSFTSTVKDWNPGTWALALMGSFVAAWLGLLIHRARRNRADLAWDGHPLLQRERARMERWVRGKFAISAARWKEDHHSIQALAQIAAERLGSDPGFSKALTEWITLYQRARFGPPDGRLPARIEELRSLRLALK